MMAATTAEEASPLPSPNAVISVIARLGNWKPHDRDTPGPDYDARRLEDLHSYLKLKQLMPG